MNQRRYRTPAEYEAAKVRIGSNEKFKREFFHEGRALCWVCGWRPPAFLWNGRTWNALHCHHVIPTCCEGPNKKSNLVVLCPNHHAIAHRLGRNRRDGRWVYFGPKTPDELIRTLKEIDQDPRAWEARQAAETATLLASEV